MGHDDRTEAPTPKRRRDARKKGQIARSAELVTWAQLLAASFLLELTVRRVGGALREILGRTAPAIERPEQGVALGLFGDALREGLLAVLPLAAALALTGVVGHVAQTGGFASLSMLKPKPERLDPRKGLRRLLGPEGLWQGAKSLVRVALLALVAWPPIRELTTVLVASGRISIGHTAAATAAAALRLVRDTAALGLVLAAADYAFQRRRTNRGMRMTKQEVKDEHRQAEGDPHTRAQIRSRQLALGRNRMIAGVADASVVIVNPTHVAVALRYEPGQGAPLVVAKGRGVVARRIREEAQAALVPIVRDVPLARTLERTVAVGAEVPVELYETVARVLAFLARLRAQVALGGVLELPQVAA